MHGAKNKICFFLEMCIEVFEKNIVGVNIGKKLGRYNKRLIHSHSEQLPNCYTSSIIETIINYYYHHHHHHKCTELEIDEA
jgi:hypothetical protein